MSGPVTYSDMFVLLTAEAEREEIIARAARSAAVRSEAHRRHDVFDKAAELIRRIADDPALKERLRHGGAR
jgi:hypothetical protein